MILLVLGYSILTSLLIGAAALAAEGGLRRAGRPVRWVWLGALLMTVAVTLNLPWDHIHYRYASSAGIGAAAAAVLEGTVELVTPWHWWLYQFDGPLGTLWIAASVAAAGLLVGTVIWGLAVRNGWERVEEDGEVYYVSPDTGPAVVGFLFQRIVLPSWTLDAPAETRRVMVAHEKEHVDRRDALLLLAASLAVVVVPWNPVVWWQMKRLRYGVEVDCDRRILDSGTADVGSYARLLIEAGHRTGPHRIPVPAFGRSYPMLERRIRAMTGRRSSHRLIWTAAGLGGALLLLGLVLAAPRPDGIMCGLRSNARPAHVPGHHLQVPHGPDLPRAPGT